MKTCPSCTKTSRREWLEGMGAWAALAALARKGDAQVKAAEVETQGTAKTCIFINLEGAPSQLDTFDVKDAPWNPPDANIQQFAGGITLNTTLFENLPRLAGDMCVLRSVKSWEAVHERGQFYLQTAHPANPAFVAETPHIGAVVSLETAGEGTLPPFLALNGGARGSTFLGGRFEPLSPPVDQGGLHILEHDFFGEQSQSRFEEKFALLNQLEAPLRSAPFDQAMADHSDFYDGARKLMYDPVISGVFRFSAADNFRYGDSYFGRACIVARNAIQAEAGVAFLSISHGGWDTHQSMFDRGYEPNIYMLAGELDRGLTALVEDLKASGHFDKTLIVMMGEFGRTPGTLNAQGGRDHHKDAQSAVMMGGGVAGGRIVGETDQNGDQVIEPGWHRQRPIYMEDITATIYSALGINWTKSITDTPSGRKFEYVPFAESGVYTAVREVFG